MSLRCGIVGLPNVGKSSLFNALSDAGAESENFPFCTIDPNIGVVPVPDKRLDNLADIVEPKSKVPTSVEFVDIAGLVKGASEGKGKGNAFLSHIREVDLIVHVVRCFDDPNVIHVEGSIDPARDIRIIEDELIFKDLVSVEKREENLKKEAKNGDKKVIAQYETVKRLREHLEQGNSARTFTEDPEVRAAYKELFLLSEKPVLYACNVSEDDLDSGNELVEEVREIAAETDDEVVTFCAKIEEEIAELDEEERELFLEELGVESAGLDRLIQAAYKELGLITFFTAGPKEVRAWTVRKGAKAPEAAGVIHSDFEHGFIRAETVSYDTYAELGSEKAIKDAGKMRQEGKDYVVQDGDVMLFRFNV
ncbi:redox-regulated ATPase YchF [Aliifodinibius sp. S!AR15-10]|uniref:redox-regulated ATPase YchF n=1 Tax=Aliifodinibius sp. S!AR15-10 TaxID=2950437 RepID=UPI0028675F8F|nr:redox-regulated ATPase YchF [Aliifodinibius sp. S!AR15-10]MDR8392383.1 redox-regulated ATPase YchF [Aliifodinibius sp. S!AR15-10]